MILESNDGGSAIQPLEQAGNKIKTAAPGLSTRRLIAEDIRSWHRMWFRQHWSEPENSPQLRRHWRDCLSLVWAQCGLRATVLLRIAYGLKRRRIPILPQMIARWNLTLHGLDVPSHIEIGPGLYIPHPVGTVVTARRLGANVTIVSCVTIGMRGDGKFPTIGDNVYIGAGARILGPVTIGDHANIGANAVVLKDVPPGATAVGVPAINKFPARKHGAETTEQGDANI